MSTKCFQSALLRMIADPDYRDWIRANGVEVSSELTAREAGRLRLIAISPGMDVNRTLHKGFRLGKLRALLPLTCRAMGLRRLSREVAAFWQARPASSFSFLPEALDFCAFLTRRRLRGKYLPEVIAYERAVLELEQARVGAPPVQLVVFRHDPNILLSVLSQGRTPRGIPPRRCIAVGRRSALGKVEWRLASGRLHDREPGAADALALDRAAHNTDGPV